ncbi:MAG: SH3 domain-containing protein [Lachnospiraceae bacterium]|nr:SH3 domain-containing protein [Lachnospiraceae bacterium]
MFRNLRYAITVILALSAVGIVFAVTAPKREASAEKRDTSATETEAETEAPSETDALPETEEPFETLPDMSFPEDELIHFEEPVQGNGGLRSYFRRKLVIDMGKVHLYLNVREKPDETSKILSVLWPSDIVTYDARQGDWFRVVMDGYFGFVHKDYVLTDEAAYEYRRSSVGYAAMAKANNTSLYPDPNDQEHRYMYVSKGDTFRITGITDGCYRLSVPYAEVPVLYCRKSDFIPFYLFQAPGDESGLTPAEEKAMAEMEISDNLKRSKEIGEEAAEEKAIYEAYVAKLRADEEAAKEAKLQEEERKKAELKRAEEARIAEELRKKALEAEARANEWKNHVSAAPEGQTADENGRRFLGTFRVTGYCHCTKCCGVWGHDDPNYQAHGSSGIDLVDNYTVSVDPKQIPFGTRIYVVRKDGAGNVISENTYLAADQGVPAFCIDIYRRSHEDAFRVSMYYAEVYVIE